MRALITGVSGQDGRYLSRHLEQMGYEVVGLSRSGLGLPWCQKVLKWRGDGSDDLRSILREEYDEIYHLSGVSYITNATYEQQGVQIIRANLQVTENLLQVCFLESKASRIFLAGSAAIFANSKGYPQNEDTEMAPNSHYGMCKAASRYLAGIYRKMGLFVSYGVLYNHESVYRPANFVTRKVTQSVARILVGKQDKLKMGRLDAIRDWGRADDFVRGYQLSLQKELPEDYIFATGKGRTVRELCKYVFSLVGLDYIEYVVESEEHKKEKPIESPLIGDASKAKNILGWKPEKTFEELIVDMLEHDSRLEGL